MKKLVAVLIGSVFLVGCVFVGKVFHFYFSPQGGEKIEKVIVIDKGSFLTVAKKLQEEQLINNLELFKITSRVFGFSGKLKRGEYRLDTNMSPRELVEILSSGKSIEHIVHIPEGYNIFQIAELLEAQGLAKESEFLEVVQDPAFAHEMGVPGDSLEGYLFPESYNLTIFTEPKAIAKMMVQNFKVVYSRDVAPLAKSRNMTMKDVVILASVIEKETGAPEERPLISSVFHNRLKIGMPLQSDPTVIYGKKGDKKNITREDLKTPSPYNTYTLRGLPKGPISNPGRDSLVAVLKPAQSEFLYFVSENNGTHRFTKTFKEHTKAVDQFQKNAKAREGKSWRDLKKNR